jgi:hypothetical protein
MSRTGPPCSPDPGLMPRSFARQSALGVTGTCGAGSPVMMCRVR